jgi:putative inorganic carbon (hco3(-)) transporter
VLALLKELIKTLLSPLAMPLIYLGTLVTIISTIFRNAHWGLYVLVAMIPQPNIWYKFHGYPLGKDFLDILMLAVIIGIFANKKGFDRGQNSVALLFFIVFNYLTLIHASFRFTLALPVTGANPLLGDFKNYAEMITLYYVVVNAAKAEAEQKVLVTIMASVMLLMAVREFRNFSASAAFSYDKRVEGPFWVLGLGANHIGAFFAHYGACLLGLRLVEEHKWRRRLYLACLLFGLHPLFFSYSRGAYVAAIAVLLFYGIVRSRKLLVFSIICAFFWKVILPPTVIERVTMTESTAGVLESSAQERLDLWQHAVQLFKDNPVFGIGYGSFGYTVPQGSLTDTHNFYLRTLCEQGVVGVSIFLLILAFAFHSGWRLYRCGRSRFHKGLGLGFAGCVVAASMTNVFGDRWSYFVLGSYFFIFWGLVDRAIIVSTEPSSAPAPAVEPATAAMA